MCVIIPKYKPVVNITDVKKSPNQRGFLCMVSLFFGISRRTLPGSMG